MVNTLRIASVAAVALAALVLASVTGFVSLKSLDAGRDEGLNRILGAPSVVEKFKDSQAHTAHNRTDAISPLVEQAQAFALILNPPAPPKPVVGLQPPSPPTGSAGPRPDPPSSARFDLLGTSYSPASQDECFAYIRMQGQKTFRWVRTGDEIGYYRVKEIRPDSIVCWDGSKDVPMFVPNRRETSTLLETGSGSVTASNPAKPASPPSASERITGYSAVRPPVSSGPPERSASTLLSPMTAEERATLGRLVDQIKQSEADSENRAAMVKKLLSEYRAFRSGGDAAEAPDSANEPNISPIQGRPGMRRRLGLPR